MQIRDACINGNLSDVRAVVNRRNVNAIIDEAGHTATDYVMSRYLHDPSIKVTLHWLASMGGIPVRLSSRRDRVFEEARQAYVKRIQDVRQRCIIVLVLGRRRVLHHDVAQSIARALWQLRYP